MMSDVSWELTDAMTSDVDGWLGAAAKVQNTAMDPTERGAGSVIWHLTDKVCVKKSRKYLKIVWIGTEVVTEESVCFPIYN